jgi:hypothetical protein
MPARAGCELTRVDLFDVENIGNLSNIVPESPVALRLNSSNLASSSASQAPDLRDRVDISRWEVADSCRAPESGLGKRGDILVAAEYIVRIEPAFERAKALKCVNAKGSADPVDMFVGIHIVDVCGAIK